MKIESHDFNGFTEETISFLSELSLNNSKPWFAENRERFEKAVFQPLQRLVESLGPNMLAIDGAFEIRPKTDKTISRIYRDIRFSKDKTPYRSNIWITFKVPSKDWHTAPAFYFEISPSGYNYGMGYYAASKTTMDHLRKHVETQSKTFKTLLTHFQKQKQFVLAGEQYKRLAIPFEDAHREQWYNRKNIYLNCHKEINKLFFSSKLSKEIIMAFLSLKPFYDFFKHIRH